MNRIFRGLTVALLLANAVIVQPGHAARLAIVIDDLGYNLERDRRAVLLPAPVSLSILPFTPDGPAIAALARQHDKDVLLHQPLENDHGTWARGLLTTGMSRRAIAEGFERALASVPFAIGINNHTGSRFTRDSQAMHHLMEVIRRHDGNLLFLDSRTTADTVAETTARRMHVPFVARDVFLDHVPGRHAIDAAFRQAIRRAQQRGYAIAIAHPREETLRFLERRLVELDEVEIVPISDLLRPTDRAALAQLRNRAFPHKAPIR